MTEKLRKLTPKQQRFCEEYVVDCNGTQAAIRAGYSENTAQEIASQNLSKLIIQQKITELMQTKQQVTKYDAARIIAMHEEIYNKAIAAEQFAPAVAVVKALTELHGLDKPQKIDINHGGGVPMFVVRGVDVNE